MHPFLILAIGVVFVIAAIAFLRIHAFFALVLAAVLVGSLPVAKPGDAPVDTEPFTSWLVQAAGAFGKTGAGLGSTAGKIAFIIALAAVIGQCLMASGAADKITRRLLAWMGEKRANYALLGSGYMLSVPVFFDTVFYMLIPLARALHLRTGKNYLVYVMAICAGGVVTHSLVPPTPGPLAMATALKLDLAVAIIGGTILGIPVAIFGGIILPRMLAKRMDIPMRETPGSTSEELREIVARDEKELPGLFISFLPVILPVILITVNSIVQAPIEQAAKAAEFDARAAGETVAAAVAQADAVRASMRTTASAIWDFLGEKNFALLVATFIAVWTLKRQKRYTLPELARSLEPAFVSAGVIILITSAGGAFGSMIQGTGVGGVIEGWMSTAGAETPEAASRGVGVSLLLIAFGISTLLKLAQGSGTVAIITTASIFVPIIDAIPGGLPYHKLYLFAAIAFGSKPISWMNDSGFWVVSKMSGFTEKEALRTWTVQLAVMGVLGLIEVLILSQLWPFPVAA